MLAALSTFGTDLLELLTSIFNPLPGVVILPLAMLWFGIDSGAILFTVAFATVWPIAINLSMGFRTVSPTIVAVGRNIGLSRLRVVTDVLIPAALPHAVTGLKTAWAFGWRTMIASELVFGVAGSKGGLGNYINNARLYFLTPRIFAGLVTIALLGVVFESVFGARRADHGRPLGDEAHLSIEGTANETQSRMLSSSPSRRSSPAFAASARVPAGTRPCPRRARSPSPISRASATRRSSCSRRSTRSRRSSRTRRSRGRCSRPAPRSRAG